MPTKAGGPAWTARRRKGGRPISWTAERVQQLRQCWAEGVPGADIARRLGLATSKTVYIKARALGLGKRRLPRPRSLLRVNQRADNLAWRIRRRGWARTAVLYRGGTLWSCDADDAEALLWRELNGWRLLAIYSLDVTGREVREDLAWLAQQGAPA